MVVLQKRVIGGRLGETLCYKLKNFRYDDVEFKIKWDSSRFYTPAGLSIDEAGHKYFDIPATEILIERDEVLNKDLVVIAKAGQEVEVIETLEGAESESETIGPNGDFICSGYIPASLNEDIIIYYKEATWQLQEL
jgi:hypothetical protein